MTDKKVKKYRYSEVFSRTIQGEGLYTGVITSWIRFFSCNLECNGFGQDDPTDASTYVLPYEKIDITDITDVNDLPVFDYGCDSSYSWSKKFRHLAKTESADDIVTNIELATRSRYNPSGLFKHPDSGQDIHMCFTGGEPIMSQHAMVDIIKTQKSRNNLPNFITVETNGTQALKQPIKDLITKNYAPASDDPDGLWDDREWFWSVSPKLRSTSGELAEVAIKPEIVAEYASVSNNGQLKFVVNGTDDTWVEVEEAIQLYREVGIDWDVWIMPVGATSQEQENLQATVCEQAFDRGYNFAPRVHAWVFDNVIGK